MPPNVATCLYVAFIFWLLRRHAKESNGVSYALWIPFLWVGIKASRSVGYWFAAGDAVSAASSDEEGSSIDRTVDLLLMIAGIIILTRRRLDWPQISRECRWLIVFYAYLLLSTVWSDYTFISFKRWFRDIGDVVMVLVILTESDPIEAFRSVFLRCVYVLVPLSVLFIKYYPDLGRYYNRWTWETGYCGITTNKNALSLLAMWGGLVLLWQLVDVRRRRGLPVKLKQIWPDLAVLLMCLWILSIADSSTSIACFVIGLLIFLGCRWAVARRYLQHVGLCLAGIAGVMMLMTMDPDFRGAVAGSLGREANLTDRTYIWDWALGLGTNPLIGSGFSSTLLTYNQEPLVRDDHLPHVHNGYLQTYVDDGMIGVCLLLAIIFSAGQNAVRQLFAKTAIGPLFMALYFASLFYNYTEVAFDRSDTIGFFVWLMSAYGIAAHQPTHEPETSRMTDDAPEVSRI